MHNALFAQNFLCLKSGKAFCCDTGRGDTVFVIKALTEAVLSYTHNSVAIYII